MTPNARDEGLRWLKQASEDLAAAGDLLQTNRFNLVCFHAQQAAEKALKAFLYAQDVEDVWGHSVLRLIDDAATYDETLKGLHETGDPLDKLYIPTRYPNGLPSGALPSQVYTKQEALDAIARSETVVRTVRDRI